MTSCFGFVQANSKAFLRSSNALEKQKLLYHGMKFVIAGPRPLDSDKNENFLRFHDLLFPFSRSKRKKKAKTKLTRFVTREISAQPQKIAISHRRKEKWISLCKNLHKLELERISFFSRERKSHDIENWFCRF